MDTIQTMPPDLPKYSLPEIERRWHVDPAKLPDLANLPYRDIEDRYFSGTRLRLRRIAAPGEGPTYKLCKKYGPLTQFTEPITNIYLTEAEYRLFEVLEADVIRKRRYSIEGGSLDLFENRDPLFEVEFASEAEAMAYSPPGFVGEEQ